MANIFALILEKGEIQRLRIINAESGKITKEINFDDSWRFGSLYWVNNERVLVAPNYQTRHDQFNFCHRCAVRR